MLSYVFQYPDLAHEAVYLGVVLAFELVQHGVAVLPSGSQTPLSASFPYPIPMQFSCILRLPKPVINLLLARLYS